MANGDEKKPAAWFSIKALVNRKHTAPDQDQDQELPRSEKATVRTLVGQTQLPVQPVGPQDQPDALDTGKLNSPVGKVKKVEEAADPFQHLPEHEAAILRRQVDTPDVKVGFFSLYRYATRKDWAIWYLSCFCTIAAGAAMPLMTVVFGNLAGLFSDYFKGRATYNQFVDEVGRFVLYFVYLSIGSFVTSYIYTVGFIYVGEHSTMFIRERYLKAMLSQNIAIYDQLGAGEITTRITADTSQIQDGISEKFGLTLNALATFVTAFVIGYYKNWKLTLILTSLLVAIVITMGAGSSFIIKWTVNTQVEYARGGTVAEEVLSSVRNAAAFNTEDKLARQYDAFLARAEISGRKLQASMGAMISLIFFFMTLNYGNAFWNGSRFLVRGEIDVGSILTILLVVMIGSFSLGNVAPNMKAFASAAAAGKKIFAAIERTSPMDPFSTEGEKPDHVDGIIELRNIKMIYPSRPEVAVMDDVSLVIPAGKQTALVGASGSGKSTIVGLVERFYDPVGGEILLDGRNIQSLNLHWLRQNISLVSQEPVLFASSIYENIRYGLLGTDKEHLDPEKQRELIEEAAKMANAHDFIIALTNGYQTNVGERGFLLSGGQKQRIAISRAIASDPKILLLDEATSALDSRSEEIVQAALDRAAKGRTTIVIAHRLSTIKNADNIVVMQQGRIVEQGTHSELLNKQGAYYTLVEAQKFQARHEVEDTDLSDSDVGILTEDDTNVQNTEFEKADSNKTKLDGGKILERQCTTENGLSDLQRFKSGKSLASVELAKKTAEEPVEYSLWELIKLVWSLNKPEWHIMLFGFINSIIAGGVNPVQSVFYAKAISALSLTDYAQLRREINYWSRWYIMLAFVSLLSNISHGAAFGFGSERLIHRARDRAFRTMLRQDIAFFDRDENNAGGLTAFLSTSVTHLSGLSGPTLGSLVMVSTTLIASIIVATAVGWKLALVTASTIPILLGAGFLRFWMLARFQARSKKAYESSAGYACEATSAIRTVASLARENDVWNNYQSQVETQTRTSLKAVMRSTVLFAASQSATFLCTALGFWYGSTLLAKKEYNQFQFFLVFSSIVFSAQSAGSIFSNAPDMGKAKHAAQQLKTLFDRKPAIDSWSVEGESVENMEGYVEFRNVHFRYPTRPEVPVLRGLNLTVKPGQYVALVGASGCGKSTTIALLERFYDPLAGGVFVDGKNISNLNLKAYRSFIALVSQEPTLYHGTIKENVLLGADREDVPDDEIYQACKQANIYDFIMSLPDGFNTMAGSKGTLLSGGQKQRIAIARALLRNPKILLLDEATSALDSDSERAVQAALDAAASGRTTIAVAHRLSTIQKADIIYVFDAGRVVESGSHDELLDKKGRYAELVTLQSLGTA